MTLEHSTFKLSLWGPYALFSRPELKVERCSYDVITPSAARGVLDAIYWHPGMRCCRRREAPFGAGIDIPFRHSRTDTVG